MKSTCCNVTDDIVNDASSPKNSELKMPIKPYSLTIYQRRASGKGIRFITNPPFQLIGVREILGRKDYSGGDESNNQNDTRVNFDGRLCWLTRSTVKVTGESRQGTANRENIYLLLFVDFRHYLIFHHNVG